MKLRDFSDEELLRILARLIHDKFKKKMKVEGGIVGLYSRILVHRIGGGQGEKNFRSVPALESAFSRVCDRQADRIHRERRNGKEPDDFLFTKEDMIGHEPSDIPNRSFAWKELQSMIGLDEVKKSIQALFNRVNVNYHRELQEKEPVRITLNRVFLGPPGTGKTTVGKLYGQVLADLGLVSSGEVVIKNPSDFIGPYVGWSEKWTKSILAETKGKILIIDDAHMLYPGSRSGGHHESDSFRTAVIDTLIAEIPNVPGEDRCVILMGYPEQMEEMFQNSNPGLARRFPIEEAFRFTDFDDFQLAQILDLKLNKQELSATPEAKKVALEVLSRARDRPNFGNGGEVENLLSQAKAAYQKRVPDVAISGRTEGIVFGPGDFDANYDRALRTRENCKSLFNDLIGHEHIIAQFEGYQQIVAGMRLRGIDPRPYIPFAFVFKGPPGTGKTTTARKVGQIFYDMGFLSRPEVVECSVSDLLAEYEGQTGHKVIKLLERALGKVLFIDEAYRLGEGQYARQAVGELVDCMTKMQFARKIIVILAGYEEDMNKLMHVNRGLRSRFATEVVFRHMRPEDCLQLLQQCVGKLGIQIDGADHLDNATMTLVRLFAKLRATKSWANGRDVERLAERVIGHVFKTCAKRNDTVGPLAISFKELIAFVESMLEKAEMEDAEMAVSATPEDHPNRAGRLNNLGIMLCRRFERTSSMADLNRAVDIASMAVEATPQDHPDRAAVLKNLGNCFGRRFERTGSMDDLNRAVDIANMAVKATPQNHPDRAGMLNNLGNCLGTRFERTGSMDDLNRAVDVASMAVEATPQDQPDRAGRLSNLGNRLGTRFERTGSMDDLNRAVDIANMAVKATPQDHPDRAAILNNLGNRLGRRFKRTGSMDDLDRALSSYNKGWSCYTASPSIRIRLARNAAGILASQANWEESNLLLQEAVNLLPTVSPRSLKHTDKQHMLADFAGLASITAATALNSGKEAYHALKLLELGRGVIAGLLMEMRKDISDLQQQCPNLADEFISLRDELDAPTDKTFPIFTDDTLSWKLQTKRRRKADQNFNKLITQIRAQPGFRNFLLPPTAKELMAAADPDPIIVVNLSSYRYDAFLIKRNRIKVLELPGLTLEEVQERARNLQLSRLTASSLPLLEWLWDVIARPSLDALGFRDTVSDNNWPRIWWVPTGLLSQLPLHAAGRHALGSAETVMDRVMSSYASSIKTLIYGRRLHVRKPASPPSDHALLVAMHETQGLSTNGILPYAANEVEMLNEFCQSLQLKPITPTLCKEDVLKHLQSCRIFHFAGHGRSDPMEPSQSCLLLEDWKSNPLTVGDLRDRRFQENPPFLGYLSACSTGANETARLADEGIHLVSALQLAGFRHVVGTL
ncbi:hypothetical protein DL770_009601 [Monosporascus sp. CRB-9-2]|nr:hypothetical protein DL770_009601 [Monosporascus sp. CRB-9-2]